MLMASRRGSLHSCKCQLMLPRHIARQPSRTPCMQYMDLIYEQVGRESPIKPADLAARGVDIEAVKVCARSSTHCVAQNPPGMHVCMSVSQRAQGCAQAQTCIYARVGTHRCRAGAQQVGCSRGAGGGRAARCCNDPAVQHAGMEYVSQQPACWPVGLQAEDLEYNYDIKGLADLRGRLIAAIAAYNGEGGGRRRRKHAAHHSCD